MKLPTATLALIVSASLLPSVAAAGDADLLAGRDGVRWLVPVAGDGATTVPRVCASLRTAHFEGHPDAEVVVQPEIDRWELRFEGEPPSDRIALTFDSFPALPSETQPLAQAGDGTLTLRCSDGVTSGSDGPAEKLRFEPQPHKNTIGYWTIANDRVSWRVVVETPGAFNVGLLQGAGKRGGGVAVISIEKDGETVDSLRYDVMQTGHFQNFVWRHAGTLTIEQPGTYALSIAAESIRDGALMDVRQAHLSPQR